MLQTVDGTQVILNNRGPPTMSREILSGHPRILPGQPKIIAFWKPRTDLAAERARKLAEQKPGQSPTRDVGLGQRCRGDTTRVRLTRCECRSRPRRPGSTAKNRHGSPCTAGTSKVDELMATVRGIGQELDGISSEIGPLFDARPHRLSDADTSA